MVGHTCQPHFSLSSSSPPFSDSPHARLMAGVGIAQIGRHRHDGGIAVGQASSGFLHSFSLKQAIDAVVEQNAEASLNFENAQTGLSGQLRDARCLPARGGNWSSGRVSMIYAGLKTKVIKTIPTIVTSCACA